MNNDLTISRSAASALYSSAAHRSAWRRWLLSAFAPMSQGQLELELPEGEKVFFGQQADASRHGSSLPLGISWRASVRVRRERFFRRCVLGGDIGFAEAFMDGDWETPDVTAVIAWFIHNVEHAPTMSGSRSPRGSAWLFNSLRFAHRVGHWLRRNSVQTARRNISEHYDLSNDFFALFLDGSMMYSSAKYTSPEMSLAEAQREKNEALCRALQLKPTDHVLEIGTGWGGWSMHAVREHGCRVTTLTLSSEQRALAMERIQKAGLADRIDVRLEDYRHVEGTYDKIVSIEMMEAIGHRYLPAFCEAVSRRLKPEGLMALQFITCPDTRYEQLRKGVDFIQKHIFPGSLLLSLNRVNRLLAEKGAFTLHNLSDLGHDYARTLRAWSERFNARLEEVRALGFDERFIRKWHYYLCYCEAAFAMRNITVVHALYSRANNLAL
ncbi:MAG TPA: cyclopropane-fatty-acyl-phospholipid synthase family protein [Opitutaceae bacterium]